MATCYICGKELPGVQTECEGGCSGGSESETMARAAREGGVDLVMSITMRPDKSKIGSPSQLEEFQLRVKRFGDLVALAFQETGLNDFCERIE